MSRQGAGSGAGGRSGGGVAHSAALVAALGAAFTLGVGGLGLYWFSRGAGGAGSGAAARSPAAAAAGETPGGGSGGRRALSLSAEEEAQRKLLDKLDRTIATLQGLPGSESDPYLSSASSSRSVSIAAARGGGHGQGQGPGRRSIGTSVERTLRDIRAKKWKKQLVRLTVQHRLRMVQLIMLHWRVNDQRLGSSSSSSLVLTRDLQAEAEQQRRADFELCWHLLHAHVHEADPNPPRSSPHSPASLYSAAPASAAAAAAAASVAAGASSEGRAAVHPFASAPFPPASERAEVQRHLLEVALDLRDPVRMWSALRDLLRLDEAAAASPSAASTAAAAAAAAASSSAAVASPAAPNEPSVLPVSLLLSLDFTSIYVCYHVSAMLGCWLLAFQLAHRLFGAARAAAQAQQHAQQHPLQAHLHMSMSSPGDERELYDALHQRALEAPVGAPVLDLALVSELATLRLLATLARQPHLLERLHLSREQVAPSVLPFSETGRVIDASSPAAATAAAGGASPSSDDSLSPRSPTALLEGVQPCAWESWQVLAYSTVVRAVVSPDEAGGRQSVLEELEQQQLDAPVHRCASSFVAPVPDEQGVPPGPSRRILRQGRLFSMTGLFQQPIPVVGSLIGEPAPLAADPSAQAQAHTLPGSTFSMQGYTHVGPDPAAASAAHQHHTGGAAAAESFYQFEYYKLTVAGADLRASSNGITASMVDAAQAQASEASPPSQLQHGRSFADVVSLAPLSAPLSRDPSTGFSSLAPSATTTPPPHGADGSRHPDSPPSAHLFASASFASLSASGLLEQHFPAPLLAAAQAQPLLQRLGSNVSSTSSNGTDSDLAARSGLLLGTPEPFLALERYQSSLPASVAASSETWTGLYRVIQSPVVSGAASMAAAPSRPRVEVHYELRLLVQRENGNASSPSPSHHG